MRSNPTNGQAGAILRSARLRAGLTQRQLADRAHTKQSAISRLEAGTVSPTVETLERLVGAAGSELVLTIQKKG